MDMDMVRDWLDEVAEGAKVDMVGAKEAIPVD